MFDTAKVEIKASEFISMVMVESDKVAYKMAKEVLIEAERFIGAKANDPTGKLASEIKLNRSKFKGGGWAVEAQGPGNYTRYYATFVELGSVNNPRPIPYLRSPLESKKKKIKQAFQDLFI